MKRALLGETRVLGMSKGCQLTSLNSAITPLVSGALGVIGVAAGLFPDNYVTRLCSIERVINQEKSCTAPLLVKG